MLLDDLGDYLSSQGIGTTGSSIFANRFPVNAPDNAICLIETGGMASDHAMATGPGLAVMERPRVQVTARSCAFCDQQARTIAHNAFMALDGVRTRTINGTTYYWITAVQPPFPMPMDKNNRPHFTFNVQIMKALSTSTSTGAI